VDAMVKASPDGAAPQEAPHPERLRSGLDLLLEAYHYAHDADRSAWDFALGLAPLRAAGLGCSELRWLVCKGYVEHKREITDGADSGRAFCDGPPLILQRRSQFVLTDAGVDFAAAHLNHQTASLPALSPSSSLNGSPPITADVPAALPHWDAELRELCVDGRLVKRFRVPSPNQERVLSAFQEEGWPARIDDPLPPDGDYAPKHRLRDTIKSLNRHQVHSLLRITGDGTGEGIRWHPTTST